jgi:hypothetical protein
MIVRLLISWGSGEPSKAPSNFIFQTNSMSNTPIKDWFWTLGAMGYHWFHQAHFYDVANIKQTQWIKCGIEFDTSIVQCPIGKKNHFFYCTCTMINVGSIFLTQ